jgi:hypothetical protein
MGLDHRNDLGHINDYDTDSDTDSDPDLPPPLMELTVYKEPLHSTSQRPKVSKLALIMRDISEQIKVLYEASALLRRPSMAGRYLRSNRSDEFGDGILPEFMPFDVGHVREKLVQWYDHWASSNQEGYTGRLSSSKWTAQADMEVPESVIYRLASSNIKRRKQLRYWLRRSDAPKSTVSETKVEPHVENQNLASPAMSPIDNITVPAPHEDSLSPSQMGETVTSRVTFSTAVVSDMNITRKTAEVRTYYEESVAGRFAPVTVPQLPRVAHIHERFECPYCGLELRSMLMRERRAWKYVTFIINARHHPC